MPDFSTIPLGPATADRLKNRANLLQPSTAQALQVLSLHLPQFLGGNPIAPEALLRPQIGGVRSPQDTIFQQATPTAAPAPASSQGLPGLSTSQQGGVAPSAGPSAGPSGFGGGPPSPFGVQAPDTTQVAPVAAGVPSSPTIGFSGPPRALPPPMGGGFGPPPGTGVSGPAGSDVLQALADLFRGGASSGARGDLSGGQTLV